MIPVFKPLIEKEEFEAANAVLTNGWFGMGTYVGKFESKISDLLHLKDTGRHAVAVSTGHAALHLAMLLFDIGKDDEIITPSFNNIADFQAILAVGAKPVFCDVLEDTLCIDLDKAEALITNKTKAIIVMDYDCFLCDHDKAKKIGKAHNIKIIHDAAHSFGAVYKGLHCGNLADATMFSFDPVKSITCLDGGALIVKTEEEVEKLHQMRLVGMGQPAAVMYGNQRAWTYNVEQLGFRYHMSNMHAAIGLAQLSKFDEIVESRRYACSFYDSQLKDVVELKVPLADYSFVVPFLYYIRVPKGKRKDFIDWMKLEGVDLGIHWQPGHWFELFKNCKSGDLSVTEKIAYEIVSLPLHSKMNLSDLEKITSKIREFFNYA
jgi:dTDP-4-amino-4,6-dideoxygalactose transaminase